MRRKTPPLELVEAFVAAGRTGSFRAAADKLALSPSAFSRRIRNLEVFLGTPLFDRSQTCARLTAAGAQYLQAIEPAMDAVFRATLDFRHEQTGALRIRAPHSFAIAWLLPRVSTFMRNHPQIDIDISIGRGLDELRAGNVDAVIMIGPGEAHAFPQDRLIDLEATMVAAPDMLRGHAPRALQDLQGIRVLSIDDAPDLWHTWTRRAGIASTPGTTTRYETLLMMYEAAAAGLGVTLGLPLFTERYFDTGRLIPCFGVRHPIDHFYSLVYASEAVSRRAHMRHFAQWLNTEIKDSQQQFRVVVDRVARLPVERVRHASALPTQKPAHSRA